MSKSPDTNDQNATDQNAFEGPDVEMPTGEQKPDGLGKDGTIPNEPDGIAAGHTGTASNFEPEEDEQA